MKMRTNPSSRLRVAALERRLAKRKGLLLVIQCDGKYSIDGRHYATLEQLKDAEGISESQNLFIFQLRDGIPPIGIAKPAIELTGEAEAVQKLKA